MMHLHQGALAYLEVNYKCLLAYMAHLVTQAARTQSEHPKQASALLKPLYFRQVSAESNCMQSPDQWLPSDLPAWSLKAYRLWQLGQAGS